LDTKKWDLIIEPKSSLLELKLKPLIRYIDLLILFIKRDITVVYKQTILGPIWFFIQPIMTTVIYVFVFGNIAKISTDGIPQPLFYMSGIVIWNYFSECFMKTSDTFTQNAGIFGKVYFPRLITPLSVVASNAIKFLIQFILFILLYLFFILKGSHFNFNITVILFPFYIILMALLGLGFGLIFSSLTTKYKDLKFLIQFGVQLLMYATPVIYPLSTISAKYKIYFQLNPITHIIEAFKYSFFEIGEFNLVWLGYSSFFTFIILIFGIIIFNKTEKDFMDTV
jgi:lipopolysaccharide transport system permease protein